MTATSKRTIFWLKDASARHDETAWNLALEYGEQAAYTYLDNIDHSISLIQESPRIGKIIFSHLSERHRHITSSGWEIIYDDDDKNNRVIIIDVQRGSP